jgi:hypothetical protein
MHTPDEDPIVAEVRRIREEYAAKFGYDMKLIDEDTKRRARESRAQFLLDNQIDESARHEATRANGEAAT